MRSSSSFDFTAFTPCELRLRQLQLRRVHPLQALTSYVSFTRFTPPSFARFNIEFTRLFCNKSADLASFASFRPFIHGCIITSFVAANRSFAHQVCKLDRHTSSAGVGATTATMFFGGGIVVQPWVSSEIRRFTCRRPILNLLKTCATALFSTSSMGSDAVGTICGPPIKVSLTNSVGRGVFAIRSICSGELIHTANPIVSHPSLSLSDRVCYQCLRKLNKDASSCTPLARKSVSYGFCSKECRSVSKGCYEVESKADWSLYHDHCRAYGLKYPLMVKRFACMVISGAASADSLDILQPARLPPGAVLQIEEQFELLKSALLKARIDENLIQFLTKHWFMGVLARVHINAFRIELVADSYEDLLVSAIASVATQAAVGNVVYMLPSFYNHNCGTKIFILLGPVFHYNDAYPVLARNS